MSSKKELLLRSRLYLILDTNVNSYAQLFGIAKKAIKNGVDIIQLRDKHGSAQDILGFSKKVFPLAKNKSLYIINDRVDLALIAICDGVHLGQDDISLRQARKILGKNKIIGVSCQNLGHVRKAQKEGADYIGFGSVFKTLTKPGRQPMNQNILEKVFKRAKIPVFAIGGIDLKNISGIKKRGVSRFAVCRGICRAGNIEKAVKNFKQAVDK